jgi:membrane protein DedA with SNARE-associated domain/diacylglycerol kinase family enzyme
MERPVRHRSPVLISSVAALALLAITVPLVSGLVSLPDVDGVLQDASTTLGAWAYPAVAGFAFLETGAFVGLAVPGETAVVVGGVVAARGDVEVVPLIGLVWLAAWAGDLVSFVLGRRLGRSFLERHGSRLRLGPERLEHVERFYARHGGKAVLVGRFAGVIRAVSPFLAGASGFALRRFLPWSAAGALLWAATFTLVGYGFSESFAESGDAAARIALGAAALVAVTYAATVWVRSGGRGRRDRTREAQRGEGAERSKRRADESPSRHVEGEVHPQVHAREGDGGRDRQRHGSQARGEDGNGGGRGERGGAVTRGKRRVVGNRGQRAEVPVGDRRALAVEELLEGVRGERRGARGHGSRHERHGDAPAPQIRAQSQPDQQRPLDPPGGEHHEQRGEPGVLEGRSGLDQSAIEIDKRGHEWHQPEPSTAARLLLVLNARASGVEDPRATGTALVAVLEELGAHADAVVTRGEHELWDALRSAASLGRRVVLVGGDGTLHAAANAPLRHLPELALVPAGRANNVARALGIPLTRADALAVAARMPSRPLDALRVATPDRFVYALEAVSAGFQAEARAGYEAENSGDLRQGLRALVRALRRYRPYSAALRLPDREVRSDSAAQIFLSNLPYFGFGFEVDPGADPADGRFEAIVIEARGRGRLLRLLAAARHGRHLGRRGVRRIPASRARLTEPLPLVADATPLGTTTATVSVEPARLWLAAPLTTVP